MSTTDNPLNVPTSLVTPSMRLKQATRNLAGKGKKQNTKKSSSTKTTTKKASSNKKTTQNKSSKKQTPQSNVNFQDAYSRFTGYDSRLNSLYTDHGINVPNSLVTPAMRLAQTGQRMNGTLPNGKTSSDSNKQSKSQVPNSPLASNTSNSSTTSSKSNTKSKSNSGKRTNYRATSNANGGTYSNTSGDTTSNNNVSSKTVTGNYTDDELAFGDAFDKIKDLPEVYEDYNFNDDYTATDWIRNHPLNPFGATTESTTTEPEATPFADNLTARLNGKYDNVNWNDPIGSSTFGVEPITSVHGYNKLARQVQQNEDFNNAFSWLKEDLSNPATTSDNNNQETKSNFWDKTKGFFGKNFSLSNDMLEKAPIYGNLAAVAADITEAKMLEDYANGLSAQTVTYNPNYNYATYNPTNLNSTTDALLGTNSGVVANLNNTGMGAAERMAATLQNNKNLFTSMGTVVNQINQANNAEKNNVRGINNAIDAQNAQQSMQAQQYNATARQTIDAQRLAAMQQALQLRLAERTANDKAKSDDLNALFTNMFNLGRNNKALAYANAVGQTMGYGYNTDAENGIAYTAPKSKTTKQGE
jgi:hypothetical protein